MEPDELKEMIRDCPLLIRMNDGREYFVEKPEVYHVGDYSAGLLSRYQRLQRERSNHYRQR